MICQVRNRLPNDMVGACDGYLDRVEDLGADAFRTIQIEEHLQY